MRGALEEKVHKMLVAIFIRSKTGTKDDEGGKLGQ